MYDFHTLKHSKTLPDDVNSFVVEELNKVFDSVALIGEIKACQDKRRYCELAYRHGNKSVRISFQSGIATSFWLKKSKDVIVAGKVIDDTDMSVELSVKNKLVKIKSKNSKGEN